MFGAITKAGLSKIVSMDFSPEHEQDSSRLGTQSDAPPGRRSPNRRRQSTCRLARRARAERDQHRCQLLPLSEDPRFSNEEHCTVLAGIIVVLLLASASAASATTLPVAISENTTLSPAGNPYTGTSTIQSGVTLKVEPGVKFTGLNLKVKGTLSANGTASEPITVIESNGNYTPITFEPGSGASVLNHVDITKSGSTYWAKSVILIKQSSPRIENSHFSNNDLWAIWAPEGGGPEIANNTFIQGSARSAIYYQAGEGKTGDINIHGNYIEGGKTDPAISIEASKSSITATTLSGNTVIRNEAATAFRAETPQIPGDVTENLLSENKSNRLRVSGTVAASATWKDGGTPITTGTVTVASGATLRLEPGLSFSSPNFIVKGTLLAEGTAMAPVIFTEQSANVAAIAFEPGSGSSVLNHVEVTKCGSTYWAKPAIQIKQSSPRIENSKFLSNDLWAIWMPEGGAPEIADNFFSTVGGRSAIYYQAGEGKTGNINIHGNFIEGGKTDAAISVNASKSSITATTLSGNTIVGSEAASAFSYSAPEIPANVTENTLIGNKSNLLEIGGMVKKPSTWKDGGTRVWPNGVTVDSGVALNLAKGLFLVNPAITVKGTLNTEGTSAAPVVFTGKKEEAAGEWRGIKFEAGSGSSLLTGAEFAYGGKEGYGMVEAKGASPTILNSTFRKATYAVKVTESGAPKLERNRFRENNNAVTYTGTGNLLAPNNDWGCANGPKPAGCGDSVTSNVKWQPAVQLPELAGSCRGKESQCGEGADPVSLATGQLSYFHRDLLLTNQSDLPLEFSRAYASGSSSDTGLGPGWSQTGLASVTELESGAALVLRQDGRQDLFSKTEGGYQAPSGVTDMLARVEGAFKLSTLERTVYRFDASGRIASITDDHGLKTTYGYDANGRLATITDPSSQTLTFSYNASNHIASVKDSTGREVKYGYSTAGNLATVTDALGRCHRIHL